MPVDNIHQLIDWQPPITRPIIEGGILDPETRLMVFGHAKSWKSMLALHTSFALAEGSPWFGFNTRPMTVLKYQVELPKAIDRKRVIKYARGRDSYPATLFFQTPQERVKLDSSWGMQALQRDIVEAQSRAPDTHLVLILDPLYKLMAGHISDEYDVKKFQDNIDELKTKYCFTVIIIHHARLTRVDPGGTVIDLGSEELMGSSYWNNWFDSIVRVKVTNPYTGGDTVAMTFELTRNSEFMLPRIDIHWRREDLQPVVIRREELETDPSIQIIKEDVE